MLLHAARTRAIAWYFGAPKPERLCPFLVQTRTWESQQVGNLSCRVNALPCYHVHQPYLEAARARWGHSVRCF